MKIAIIGAGNMGGSIARGLAKGSLINDSDIIVSNPSAGKLEKLKKEFPGISTTNNNLEAATGADIVILAVKPWFMEPVMRELKLKSKQILISVAAVILSSGISITVPISLNNRRMKLSCSSFVLRAATSVMLSSSLIAVLGIRRNMGISGATT